MDIVERLLNMSHAYYYHEHQAMRKEAANEIERLRKALRFMLDNDRNLQKPLEELFAEFCNEARKALGETEPEELGEKE